MPSSKAFGGAWLARAAATCCVALVLTGGLPQAWGAPFSGVIFEDAPALDAERLLPAYQSALGQPITGKLPRQVGRDLIRLYQRSGYLAPAPRLVRVHDQAGVLAMEMREPQVIHIHLNGREHVDAAEFWALIRALRATRPLSRGAFDEWLERANSLGFAVQGSLLEVEPGSARYAASLNVTKRRWQGVMHLDNRGPAQLGHEIAQCPWSTARRGKHSVSCASMPPRPSKTNGCATRASPAVIG